MSVNQENISDQINKKIGEFKANISQYHSALNDEGVWLFLSALGCWGVSDNRFKFVALLITLFLFGWRVHERREEKRSFSAVIKSLEEEVNDRLQEDEVSRDATLYKLIKLKEDQLSFGRVIRSAWPFILAWAFFGSTFIYFFVL